MQHVLDNPVWHALIGPHAEHAIGQGLARHYPRDIAPFSAIADATSGAYADLGAKLPAGLEAPSERRTGTGRLGDGQCPADHSNGRRRDQVATNDSLQGSDRARHA